VYIAVRKQDEQKLVFVPEAVQLYPYKVGAKFKEDTLLVVRKHHI
jgi:hypothetical protein